eukprot:15381163-Alexandrium_andersonii.AAC.1
MIEKGCSDHGGLRRRFAPSDGVRQMRRAALLLAARGRLRRETRGSSVCKDWHLLKARRSIVASS